MSVLKVYNPIDLEIDHGDGVYVYSADGTRYLDLQVESVFSVSVTVIHL